MLTEHPDRLDQPLGVECGALRGRRRILRQGLGRRRDRTAKPLERQLPVEQLRVGRGALEVIGRRLELSGSKRRASRPVIALGVHLERAPGASIGDEVGKLVLERAVDLSFELAQAGVEFDKPLRPFGVAGCAAKLRIPDYAQLGDPFMKAELVEQCPCFGFECGITAF